MTPETGAVEFGREEDYPGYEMSHQAVHGNDLVHSMSRELDTDGVMAIGKPRQDYLDEVAAMAAGSGVHLVRSFHAISGTAVNEASLAAALARLDALGRSGDSNAEP